MLVSVQPVRVSVNVNRDAAFAILTPPYIANAVRAMLAAAIRIDRAVEADVGRAVAADDRPRALDRHGGSQARRLAVDRKAIIEPVAIGLARWQVEALALAIERRTATGAFVGH